MSGKKVARINDYLLQEFGHIKGPLYNTVYFLLRIAQGCRERLLTTKLTLRSSDRGDFPKALNAMRGSITLGYFSRSTTTEDSNCMTELLPSSPNGMRLENAHNREGGEER